MRKGGILCGVVWALASGWALLAADAPAQGVVRSVRLQPDPVSAGVQATLDQYCVTCHNERTKTAGLMLDRLDPLRPEVDAGAWERVVRKLRTRTMPPHGSPRPDEAAYDALAASLETALDRAAAATPRPGRQVIRRLNRSEYANAVRDLLDLDVDVAQLLPPDDAAFGFDNNSDLLGVSPSLLERYVVAADRVSALAVGARVASGSQTYRIRQDRSQDQHIDGLPLGTVGGAAVTHMFPVNGEYRFSLELFRTNLEAIRGLEHPHEIEISVDGARVFAETVGGETPGGGAGAGPAGGAITDRMNAIDARLQVQVPVTAGPHVVGASFVRKIGAGSTRLRPFLRSSAGTYDNTGRPHIETLTIAGPFNQSGPGETPSRRRIFTCGSTALTTSRSTDACATSILTRLARRAYRRPVTGDDLARLRDFYRAGAAKGGFEAGIQMALRRMLASPSFVYRVEENPPSLPSAASARQVPPSPAASARQGAPPAVRVSDVALASRLSFFLWSSIPDETLLAAAERGELRTPAAVERQVRRMLADPRASALVTNFAGQWLHVRNLQTITPNHDEFPDFDDTLREAFRREIELFVGSVITEDRSVLDLLTADYTFVNERLAKHYGLPYIYGSHFRRVTVADDARRGLLGKGSLLLVTSHADRTAPVLRGKWILENLLGTPPPPPPANFTLAAEDPGAPPRSLRERMERHRASPACSGCHRVMDPLGFALENFDAVGAWRARDAGRPVDASGELADGTKVDGVVALRQALVARSDVFVQTLTERLMTYGLGRGLDATDMPAVRGVVRRAARANYRISEIMVGIAASTPFQMRAASR